MRSTQNALRQALSLPVYVDPLFSEEVETLARAIAGPGANAELARQVAEAEIDLRRVRCAPHQFLSRALADPDYCLLADAEKKVAIALRLLRNKDVSAADLAERRALSRPPPFKPSMARVRGLGHDCKTKYRNF